MQNLIKANTDFFLTHGVQSTLEIRHAAAPARLEVLGSHLDYVAGYSLAGCIDKYCVCSGVLTYLDPNSSSKIQVSYDRSIKDSKHDYVTQPGISSIELSKKLDELRESKELRSFNYIYTCLRVLACNENIDIWKKLEDKQKSLRIAIKSNIPKGAGLGSSAAYLLSFVLCLNKIFKLDLTDLQILNTVKRTEEKIGALCGALDMSVSYLAPAADIRSYSFFKMDFTDITNLCHISDYPFSDSSEIASQLLLINTNIQHENACEGLNSLVYNYRSLYTHLKEILPTHLMGSSIFTDLDNSFCGRALTSSDFHKLLTNLSPNEFKLWRRSLQEQDLVKQIYEKPRYSDRIKQLGECMCASYETSKNYLGNSHPKLDALANHLKYLKGVEGYKLHGAGFGGCMLVLLNDPALVENIDIRNEINDYLKLKYPHQVNCSFSPINLVPGAKSMQINK